VIPADAGVGNVKAEPELLAATTVNVRVVPAAAGSGDTDTELIVTKSRKEIVVVITDIVLAPVAN
jgi:hypothetical protein